MRVLSSICAAAIIAVAVTAAPEAAAQRGRNNDQSTSVVVINYNRVLAESALGRDIQARLGTVRTEIQTEALAWFDTHLKKRAARGPNRK